MMENLFLFNENSEGLETAVIEDSRLVEYTDSKGNEDNEGSVVIGRIIEYAGSLEAYFVDIGSDRNAYLPNKNLYGLKPKVNAMMPFQILRESRENKGMTLSCRYMITGEYTVCGNIERNSRVSSKIGKEGKKRFEGLLKEYEDCGRELIIRTAAADIDLDEIRTEIEKNLTEVRNIENKKGNPGDILFRAENSIDSLMRRFSPETDKAYFNDIYTFNKYFEKYGKTGRIKHYNKDYDMFDFFNVSNTIRGARQRNVGLKSGGELVFDYTEAMVVIDINSAGNSSSRNFRGTVMKTNMEAAEEIAVQLRLRNLGGIIIIDFIETDEDGMKEVDNYLRNNLQKDQRRIEIGGFTALGNYEIIRERKGRRLKIGKGK